MSEHLELQSSKEIRDWIDKNGFDIVNLDSEAPRFFQPKYTVAVGPMHIYGIQHTYLTNEGHPLVSVQRSFSAPDAEDAFQQYLQEPKERSFGGGEERVGFKLYMKPGAWENETVSIFAESE